MTVSCIMFDLDGVLINSVDAWFKSIRDVLKSFMFKPPSDKELHSLLGMEISDIIDRFVPNKIEKREEKVRTIFLSVQKRMETLVSSHYIKEHEGVKELLWNLKQDEKKIGLVTSANRIFAEKALKHFNIERFFDAIVTKDDVKNKKPHPEPVLKAVELLGCKPENCFFVGDAETDIIAGKTASVTTVLYNSSGKNVAKMKTQPDNVITKLNEILTLI